MISILLIGDIVGRPGREVVKTLLPELKEETRPNIVIGNIENLAHGKGVTGRTFEEISGLGIDVYTTGNHIWKKDEGIALLESEDNNILRPANYPEGVPGKGHMLAQVGAFNILVINLQGRVFMHEDLSCPFRAFDSIIKEYEDYALGGVVVDFHAEATSEKIAFAHYIDGRAALVAGTHTHVPTADARILEQGTAAITDVGMTGAAKKSVLGVEKNIIINNFLKQLPVKHEPSEEYPYELNAVHVEWDTSEKKAKTIRHIRRETPEE